MGCIRSVDMQRPTINVVLSVVIFMVSCWSTATGDDLFTAFVTPPAEAKPFVRWWWGENSVVETEILREIDVMHEAGIGGFEINPISLPVKMEFSSPSLQWLSPEFNRLVKVAVDATKERGMFCDSIELSAANWTTDMLSVFAAQHGYDLAIKVTTMLHNHIRTLDKASCAGFWTRPTPGAVSVGLIGPVQLRAAE